MRRMGSAIAAFFAGTVGSGPVLLFINSMMIGPVTHDFQWGRGTYGFAVLLSTLSNSLAVIFVGRAADRFGVRRVVLPGILFYALAMIAMSFGTSTTFALLFALLGACASTQGPQLYAKVISAWYAERRALALALTAVGAGFGGAIWPIFIKIATDHFGWRGAYVSLGIAIFLLAFPVSFFLLREPRVDADSVSEQERAKVETRGLSLSAIVRTPTFWLITISQTISIGVLAAILSNAVALLSDRGLPASIAPAFLGTLALSGMIGRLLSGYLLDRLGTPRIAIAFFAAPLPGLLLLAHGGPPLVLLGALCFGIALGSEVEIAGYFLSRYFGLKNYAGAFSVAFAVFAIGAGLGPFFIGRSFDAAHNYNAAFVVLEISVVVAAFLVACLGPYTFDVNNKVAITETRPIAEVA